MPVRELVSDNDDKEPKWRQTHVIGAIGVFFLLFLRFFILTNILLYIEVIIYLIHDMEHVGRRRERAQTTRI